MFASLHTSWILQGQSALLHCLPSGVCRRLNGYIYRIEKDAKTTMLLVTSFCLLSCSLETHSESTDEGSNSSCGWEKRVCTSSSCPLSYWVIRGGCLFLSILVQDLRRITHTLSSFRPVNTFDLSRQLKKIYVYTGVVKKRHCIKLNKMRLGYFSPGIYGRFYFQLYSNSKIILLGWSSSQLNNKAIVGIWGPYFILFSLPRFVHAASLTSPGCLRSYQ